jgi:tetratricopeptide (TPR) repeat protein
VLLVFEDLHWIDGETQALLDSLVDSLPTARLLLLVNYRPEYEHGWGRKTYYQQLRLDALPAASAEELLQALLGDNAALQSLKRLLVERTEGNPFFLEESVQALVETGVLGGERGAYRLARPPEHAQVPATVQAVLTARIDRLAPEDKRLLQSAAVIGKDVPYALLAAIAELPEPALRAGLARLQTAEFLYEAALFPELEYTFKHALTHEVAYGSLLGERRRALHGRIVNAIEALYSDRLAVHIERLAHHALHGEAWEKAVTYQRQAGTKAAGRPAHRQAVTYFEQALDALNHLPRSARTDEQAIDIRFELRNSLVPLAEHARLREHLREAESLAAALDDQRRLGWVHAYTGTLVWWLGDNLAAIQSLDRALEVATSIRDPRLEVIAKQLLGSACFSLGDYSRAIEVLRQNIIALEGDPIAQRIGAAGIPAAGSRAVLVLHLAERGEFAEGELRAREAVLLATEATNAYSMIYTRWTLGYLYVRKGELDEAIPLLTEALDLAANFGIPNNVPRIEASLGEVLAQKGQLTEAVPLLERAIERLTAAGEPLDCPLILTRLAEAYLLSGGLEGASDVAGRALAQSRHQHERGSEAWALRLCGVIAAHPDAPDTDQAQSYFRQALALADELGMRPLAAHCHLGLGTLYQKVGRTEEARAEVATAAEMYRAMEMTFWLQKAESITA